MGNRAETGRDRARVTAGRRASAPEAKGQWASARAGGQGPTSERLGARRWAGRRPLHPDDAVGVEHHFDEARVVEQIGERAERALERAGAPRSTLGHLGLRLRRHLRSSINEAKVLREIDIGERNGAREPSGVPRRT